MILDIFKLLKFFTSKELSRKSSFFNIVIYLFSISYLVYFLMDSQGALVKLEVKYWNIIYWIILLFTIINNVILDFSIESKNIKLYLYTLVSSDSFIISKIIFHSIYSFIFSMILLAIFNVWFGSPVVNMLIFILIVLLSSIGYSSLYCMIASISSNLPNSGLVEELT